MSIRLEFVPQDCWIGVYWHVLDAGDCRQVDVYVCLLPMLPLHITVVRKSPFACPFTCP